MNPSDYLPFVVAIVLIVTVGVSTIVTRAIEYREKVDMLKHGYVPKGYQPINPAAAQSNEQPAAKSGPAALPFAPWSAQEWSEGVPTSRYVGELAKDTDTPR